MKTATKPLLGLTAADLMTRDMVVLPKEMSLQEAARLLLQNQIGGAPVVDGGGRCVGVLSATDFVRWTERKHAAGATAAPPCMTCRFQVRYENPDGEEQTFCALPLGVCPVQREQRSVEGGQMIVCSQPHAVFADWQVVEVDDLPAGTVGRYMTADPVTVTLNTPIRALARLMIDAHMHRVIAVDEWHMPVGVVSSTDILAAVAHADGEA